MAESVLLVDLGNSRLKWAVSRQGVLGDSKAVAWRGADFPALLEECWGNLESPASVKASVVAPARLKEQLRRWVESRWGVPLQLLTASASGGGITCGYRDPDQLGADRWAAMVAAHFRYPQGGLVVDCGTATTLDALVAGRHLGGYILPGMANMREAVIQETALANSGETALPGEAWGRSTASCIELGVARAVVALIEHSLERLQAAGVCDPTLVVTGGQAGFILPFMQVDYRRHDDLVLEGIMLCSERLVK